MISVNPANGEVNGVYEEHTPKGVAAIINSVDKAWQTWRSSGFAERSRAMTNLAILLRSKRDELARTISLEMGKVLRESKAEVEKCAWVCEYYADKAEGFLMSEPVQAGYTESYVCFRPLGVILAVMPWNFPFWQVFRFAAPTIMAGNTIVLKHASNVPFCALAIEDLFREAGFPENAFRTLLMQGPRVKEAIAHKAVKGVTITGSTPAGRSVAAEAGQHLKKCVLELGGNDPYLILEDADLENATHLCAAARLLNAGQSCIAAKRFIVVEPLYEKFCQLLTAIMSKAVHGDPFLEETTIGPLARINLRDELHRQVEQSVALGAHVLSGGKVPKSIGAFYPPTILTGVKKGMPAWDEELFGPVATVIKVKNTSEAIMVANDTEFGLGAAIFSSNLMNAKKLAEELVNAGSCFINDFVRSDPRLPFGGIANSGYGRELSEWGIREFVNVKTIVVR